MSTAQFSSAKQTTWCPGCGNFSILSVLADVLNETNREPRQVLLMGGIGQAAKTNQYINANAFTGLHGRILPAAIGAKLANSELTVIVNSGDGDSYGEGGNHFLHAIRRNVDITHFAHNNQIYGLTRGQPSPTTDEIDPSDGAFHNIGTPFNPALVAIAAGAGFVARSFTGNQEHLKKMMHAAIAHKGYALVDILQPCVSFNKVNTFAYYAERVYELGISHDATDKALALAKALEGGDKIPIGILYRNDASLDYQERNSGLFSGSPLIDRPRDRAKVVRLLQRHI